MSDVRGKIDARAEGPWSDLALHSIGWKAFQDLCSQICEEILGGPVQIYREAQDGGQDAVLILRNDKQSKDTTVQCKHSTDRQRRLHISDITVELSSIKALVQSGQADTYIFMTSMGVDAPVARRIRDILRGIGVKKPHVLGREYIIRTIRSSARLRALVPQVYGLGDLSVIVDQRMIQQTRALLDYWIPKLKLYVPTKPHRLAVRALSEHGIVLLLGNASTGKSMIGAILSTVATEDRDATVIQLTGPREFLTSWSPHDRKRFFWIDDAFGSNVMREDYVQDWAEIFPKIQSALARGNRFLFTSRRHIYEAAKRRLGQRNLSLFLHERAVVNVGDLTADEKAQILYNHVAFGNQALRWKRAVKPHLNAVAAVAEFLPGIAERLGDPAFTRGLGTSEVELVRFMREPREHLIDTINALEAPLRAALMLIYVHRGRLPIESGDQESVAEIIKIMDTSISSIEEAFPQILGSFTRKIRTAEREFWGFSHPTIADALTSILRQRSLMIAALLRGAPLSMILSEFVCEGAEAVPDAPIVPATLNETLVRRLLECEDSLVSNWQLVSFLSRRASDAVVKAILNQNETILDRMIYSSSRAENDPVIKLHARAWRLGVLSESRRERVAQNLQSQALEQHDLSFFSDPAILNLIPSIDLVSLGLKLRINAIPDMVDEIERIRENADLDDAPESHFKHLIEAIETIKEMVSFDEETGDLVEEIEDAIAESVADIERRKEDRETEYHDNDDIILTNISIRPSNVRQIIGNQKEARRSIFEDVDHAGD